MNFFDIAKQIVRADTAMLQARVPVEQRSLALNNLAESLARAGLRESEEPQKVVPIRRPL